MLLWVTGCSGAGKATLGEGLRDHGFTHFDGDVWGRGGDATSFTGSSQQLMEQMDDTHRERWQQLVDNFEVLFAGGSVELDAWLPFHEPMCDAIEAAWREHGDLVVSFAVYPQNLRDWIKARLPAVQFIVLHDPQHQAVARKVQAAVDAARAKEMSLREFLHIHDRLADAAGRRNRAAEGHCVHRAHSSRI